MDDRARYLSTLLVLAWSMAGTLEAQVPHLVRDIEGARFGSSPQGYVALAGESVVFVARSAAHGRELWMSDGTPPGTRLVRDVRPGPESSRPYLGAVADGLLFFLADDGEHGRELWRSDGSEAGTFMVRDFAAGPESAWFFNRPLVAGEDVVYFEATTPEHGSELWRSDGTDGGTVQVADLVPGPESSSPTPRLVHRGLLYFTATDAAHGQEPWISDGTAAGTSILADLAPGPASSDADELTVSGERVCFAALDALWCTDGTAAGTSPIHDFGAPIRQIVAAGDLLFVNVRVSGAPDPWFVSDGSSSGAVPIFVGLDIIRDVTAVGDRVFFRARDGVAGAELWISDGSAAGTRLVRDIDPGSDGSFPSRLAAFGDRLVFVARDDLHGDELWISDGSGQGTGRVVDLTLGGDSTNFGEITPIAGRIWFTFFDAEHGYEPWISDGTAASTQPLGALAPEFTSPSNPRAFVALDEGWLFNAESEALGRELWITDATPAGTRLVSDIQPGPGDGLPSSRPAAVLGGRAYFEADDGVDGRALWTTDGTAAGTRLVRRIDEGGGEALIDLTAGSDRLFFLAGKSLEERLWTSDGTRAGTVPLLGVVGGRVCTPTPFADGVAFVVENDQGGGLWRSDGTPRGTARVRDLRLACPFPTRASALRVIDGVLYFDIPGRDGELPGLWRSDGTEAGTVPVAEIPDLAIESPAFAVGARIAFTALHPIYGREPWITDDSAAGASVLVDLQPGAEDSFPRFLASLGADTLFSAAAPDLGSELWRTDGTPQGTRLVADLYSGPRSSFISGGAVVDSHFFFAAVDADAGRELWVTDGRKAGTRVVVDLLRGFSAGVEHDPALARHGRRLLFAGNDGVRGNELWALDTLCFFGGRPLDLHDGRFRVDACWRRPDGRIGVGTGVALTDEAGAFSFFNPDNLDLGLKVIDGRRVNGKYWFFFASLTDVAGKVRVTDTENGRYRDFELLPGRAHSFAAVDGFPEEQPVSAPLPPLAGPPSPGPIDGGCDDWSDELCVQAGRFRVRVAWETERGAGVGHAARTGANSGTFWFFRPDNVELMVKVHDGRPRNGHFWVFFGALSNVRYTVTVTDLLTGAEREYESAQGRYTSVADTRAFAD